MTTTATVDVNVPRFGQALTAGLTALAFVVQAEWLVMAVFIVLAVSWVGGPRWAPFTRLYEGLVRPRLHRPIEVEPAAPPRFAQLVGGFFLGAATISFLVGMPAIGWGATLLVTALAALAATTRICVGCLIYRQVVRG